MTRIIEFLIALGIVAGLFVIIGVCLPGERHISESIETNRKMTIVFDTVNSLRRFKDWNPLVLRDPAVELKLSGPAAGVGARLDYSSKESSLGQGSWEITESEKNKLVSIAIEDPTKGHDKKTSFTLERPARVAATSRSPRTTASSTASTCLAVMRVCMSAVTSVTT